MLHHDGRNKLQIASSFSGSVTMIKTLSVSNIGPSKQIDLSFGSRLNVITGDNGLGKSFLLDLIWFAMTRQWPQEVNPGLTSGSVARPNSPKKKSSINAVIQGAQKEAKVATSYSTETDRWVFNKGKPVSPGLVFYLMADGSFAVWDSERNRPSRDSEEPPPAFVLSNKQVFNGLDGEGDAKLCNGLIADWATWSDSRSYAALAEQMDAVLKVLSPVGESYSAGLPVRVGISDSRRVPTIKMPYGTEVPITQASSGIKRIAELAYMFVWSVNEHAEIAKLKGKNIDTRVTVLIDEVESHLHPRWQRSIVPALLEAIKVLYKQSGASVSTQLIVTTHSPLVMSSIEGSFDSKLDKWFDLDFDDGNVLITNRDYYPLGSIENWLTSKAFDLQTTYSREAEKVLQKAKMLLQRERIKRSEVIEMTNELSSVLPEMDPYWICWNAEIYRRGLRNDPS